MTAALIRLITGVQARWVGQEPVDADDRTRQRVFFANHTSNLDGPVIWASLPKPLRVRTRPVAARDYWDGGPLRRWLAKRVFNCVLIERKKVTKSNNPIEQMDNAIAGGCSLIIFPEGGRTVDEEGRELMPFKSGLYHLAKHHPSVQCVPVYLENLNRILPKGEFILIPLIATARFGPPITLGPGEDKESFLARARAAVLELRQGAHGDAADQPARADHV